MKGSDRYTNDVLNYTAPNIRPATTCMGHPIQKATITVQLIKGMTKWPNDAGENSENATNDQTLFMSYCRWFHEEVMCAKCQNFNQKGTTYCVQCLAILQGRDDPARWKELNMPERVKFVNATLNKLVWKANPQFRSYKTRWR